MSHFVLVYMDDHRLHDPLPPREDIEQVILENNQEFEWTSMSGRIPNALMEVECKKQPRDMPTYNLMWMRG